jgi:hypothetical protein
MWLTLAMKQASPRRPSSCGRLQLSRVDSSSLLLQPVGQYCVSRAVPVVLAHLAQGTPAHLLCSPPCMGMRVFCEPLETREQASLLSAPVQASWASVPMRPAPW